MTREDGGIYRQCVGKGLQRGQADLKNSTAQTRAGRVNAISRFHFNETRSNGQANRQIREAHDQWRVRREERTGTRADLLPVADPGKRPLLRPETNTGFV